MTARAVLTAYINEHVQTPRCPDWDIVIRQLTPNEWEQVADMTEDELTAYLQAANYDMAQRTLESYAASIEALRKLIWAERNAAQQIIERRKANESKS